MLIQMAVKNVFRNRKRTMITVLAVFWGVLLSIVANGVNKGLEWQMGNMYIKTDSSSLKIVDRGFNLEDLENPVDYPIKDDGKILRTIKGMPDVKAYSPQITFHSSLSNGSDEIRAIGLGVDPGMEDQVFQRSSGVVQGHYMAPGEEGIMIGKDLAKLLGLKPGDTVTVISQATQMGINAYDLEIKGLIETGNPVLDSGSFWVPLAFARDFLSFTGVTDIAVALRNNNRIHAFSREFAKHQFPDQVKVASWRDYAKDYIELVKFRSRIISVLMTMILLMAAAGIMNTMLMATMERKREIGNLMALGVRREEIVRLFLTEGMMIGVLGSMVAVVIGSSIVAYFQWQGIPLGVDFMNNFGSVPIAGKLYAYLEPLEVVLYFFMGITIAVISTIYPAIKSARLQPVDAIRGTGGK
jgi:putative ABC transport system permease protein